MSKSIVIIGGGFAGAYLARGLERSLPAEWELVLFSEENFLTFTPLLAEVVGSSIAPEHVVRPVRQFLRRTLCRTAAVTGLRLDARAVDYRLPDGRTATQSYDHLVLACGMVVNTNIMPGVAAHAFPLKTMGDALALRNRILTQLERAEVETDPERRRHLLSFAVIGGGFSGVEVAGEIFDLLIACRKFYPSLRAEPPRVVILHGPRRLLTELPESLGDYACKRLESRGLTIRLDTHAHAVTPLGVTLNDGSLVPAGTVVCTIGNTVGPLMAASGLPLEHGRLRTEPDMRIPGQTNVWALGDCALVPNAEDGKPSPTLAQFALRQARQLADNMKRAVAGEPTRPFSFRMLGSFAAIGHHNAVGQVLGLKVSGFFAWVMWRTIYLGKMPTLGRKIQVAFDWFWDMFFPRDIVMLNPRTTHRVPRAHYEPGEYVFHQGDEAEDFYIIERGRAGLYVKGSEEAVAILGPGDHFGAGAILESTGEPMSVRAEESLDVLAMGRSRVIDLADHLRLLRRDLEGRSHRLNGALTLREKVHDDPRLSRLLVRDVMTAPAPTLSASMTFADAIAQVRRDGAGIYTVVDAQGKLQGVCTANDLTAAVYALKPPTTPLAEIMSRPAPILAESKSLGEAMRLFILQQPTRPFIVVADDDATRPVGVLTPFEAVSQYASLLGHSAAEAPAVSAGATGGV
jgi:NADH:ubiquinone reductase (H+-translocating)